MDIANMMMKQAQQRFESFQRNAMETAVEVEEAQRDMEVQMRAMNNMARREAIGFNGLYGRGHHMNLGGMGVLPGSRAAMNTMMFEQALAPFGGYDLGGMGSYGLSSYDLRGMYGGMSCGVHPYSPYGSMMGVGMMGGGYPYSPSLYNGGHPYSMLHHPHHGVHHGCAMPGRHHPLAHTHHHIHGGYPHSRHHHHGMYGGMPPLYDPAFASDVVTSRMMGGMII